MLDDGVAHRQRQHRRSQITQLAQPDERDSAEPVRTDRCVDRDA
jgi:hypothetical protein